MNPFDMNGALDGMVILIDTREQNTPRLRERIKQMSSTTERKALSFGDYSAKFPLPNGEWLDLSNAVVVERKMDFDELCHCYCQDRARFEREFERAQTAGAKTYLLIENATWEKAYNGTYRSRMRPSALVASILAWLARYDCQILFCRAETSGKLIHDVLYREGKQRLEAMEDSG